MPHRADKTLGKSFTLPFITPAATRIKDFTKDMEMAAILYLAESKRRKGENRIIKKADEKLAFITEAFYPIWLVPFGRTTLLFDGLGINSCAVPYDAVPNVRTFNKDIQETKKKTEAYAATLFRNADYFKGFTSKETKLIRGLIAAPRLVEDFKIYLQEIKKVEKPFINKAVLSPLIERHEIRESVGRLLKLRKRIDRDIQNIDASMRALNAATAERTKAIRKEIRKTRKKHNKQGKKIKAGVERTILQIQRKHHRQVTRSLKRFSTRLRNLRKNEVRLQKTLRHLRTEVKRLETGIHSKRREERKQIETRWTLRLKIIKKKLPALNKEIEKTTKKIRDVEDAQKLESAKLRTECNENIEAAKEPLHGFQASNEAEMMIQQQRMAALEDATSRITNQMCKIVRAKREVLIRFDNISLPVRRQTKALVYVPFYVARYEKEARKRYAIYPPSIANDLGVLTKMKGALGATKMKTLLRPRSKAIAAFLNQFVAIIERKPTLEKEVIEAGIEDSILLKRKLRIGAKKGLEKLKKENWMSKDELQTISTLLYVYA